MNNNHNERLERILQDRRDVNSRYLSLKSEIERSVQHTYKRENKNVIPLPESK